MRSDSNLDWIVTLKNVPCLWNFHDTVTFKPSLREVRRNGGTEAGEGSVTCVLPCFCKLQWIVPFRDHLISGVLLLLASCVARPKKEGGVWLASCPRLLAGLRSPLTLTLNKLTVSPTARYWLVVVWLPISRWKAGALCPLGFGLFVSGRVWHELQVSLSASEMVIALWPSVGKLARTLAHE